MAEWWQQLSAAVRWWALERVDLVDADGSQTLRQMQELLSQGGGWGAGPGMLTAVVENYTANGTTVLVSLGPFQFHYTFTSRDDAGAQIVDPGPPPPSTRSPFGDGKVKATSGLVLLHDPADSDQAPFSTFDVTSHTAYIRSVWFGNAGAWPATFDPNLWPYLWARPVLVATSPDARREWDTATHTEVAVTDDTRLRPRIEFALAVSQPAVPVDGSGVPTEPVWVKIGRVARWEDLSAAQYNVDGNGAGPALPRIYPLSAFDGGDWVEFVQGEIWDESTNPPVLGQWAWSQFLSPFPAWWNVSGNEGFLQSGGTTLNRGFNTPPSIGVVSALGILADRLRAHLVGEDTGSLGTAGWWERPSHGIKWLNDRVVSLVSAVAQLAIDVDNVEADVAALSALPRLTAWGFFPWNEGLNGYNAPTVEALNLNPVPYPQGSGVVRVYISSGVTYKSAVVSPVKNSDNNLFGGPHAGFDNTKGGFKVSFYGFGSDMTGNYLEVYCEGPDNSTTNGSQVWTYGGFSVALYDEPA